MFEETSAGEPRNKIGDWVLRGGIALVFVLFGLEKFSSNPAGPWVKLFQQIGIGQWFRDFTGAVELLGGVLVAIPKTARVGLALLATTMASAALILDFQIRRPGDSVISTGLFILLAAFWWARRGE
jgi:putative oxidoreductase